MIHLQQWDGSEGIYLQTIHQTAWIFLIKLDASLMQFMSLGSGTYPYYGSQKVFRHLINQTLVLKLFSQYGQILPTTDSRGFYCSLSRYSIHVYIKLLLDAVLEGREEPNASTPLLMKWKSTNRRMILPSSTINRVTLRGFLLQARFSPTCDKGV